MLTKTEGARSPTTTSEWLESPYLRMVMQRVADKYGFGCADLADLTQDVRIALWQHGLETPVVTAWVSQVASRKAIDLMRRNFRIHRLQAAFASRALRPDRDPELELLLLARSEQLSLKLRQFYDLRYREGFSEREIAKHLSLCRASVRWLDRACRREVIATRQNTRPSSAAKSPSPLSPRKTPSI